MWGYKKQSLTRTLPDIRCDFPSLSKLVYGKRYAFLDSAASSLKPISVVSAMSDFLLGDYANVRRGLYHDALSATDRYEHARAHILQFFGGDPADDILIFTRNATEAINVVAGAVVRSCVQTGDRILITAMEHHANLVPWQMLAKHAGAKLAYVYPDSEGQLSLSEFEKVCKELKPKVVAFAYVSNVLGTVNPISEMAAIAKRFGALVLIDGAQAGMHLPFHFHETGADFMVATAHKMLGPTGVGALIAKRSILETAEPFEFGGDMISRVDLEESQWNILPNKFEAGTPAIAEAIGWDAACTYLENLGWDMLLAHEQELLAYAYEALCKDQKLTVYGPSDVRHRSSVVSFNVAGVHAHDVGTVLDQEGVAVRVGHHCAQVLMRVLDVPATVRLSVGVYNTKEDIDQCVAGLSCVYRVFHR